MSDATHDHPRELLSPYLDDELSADERARIDRHLALCSDCREHLDALRRLSRAVAAEEVPSPPADFEERVFRRIDAASVVPMRRRRFVVPASIAATIAAVGLVAVVTWKRGAVDLVPPPEHDAEQAAPTRLRDKIAANAPSEAPAPPAPPAPSAPPPPAADDGLSVPAGVLTGAIKKEKRDDAPAHEPAARIAMNSQVAQGAREADASKDEKAVDAIGGVSGGAFAVAPSARNELKASLVPCAEPIDDSGVETVWTVADRAIAARDLAALAASHGWRLEAPGAESDASFAIVLPRARYGELVSAAREVGIEGLDGARVDAGGGCVRQRIALRQAAPR